MSKQRLIDTHFWRDHYIAALKPESKLLYNYFLTAPDSNVCGVYEVPMAIICSDTGLDEKTILRHLDRFEQDRKIKYFNGWIALKKQIFHQRLNNKKIAKGVILGIDRAPQELVGWVFDGVNFDDMITKNLIFFSVLLESEKEVTSSHFKSLITHLKSLGYDSNNINPNSNINSNSNLNSNPNSNSKAGSVLITPQPPSKPPTHLKDISVHDTTYEIYDVGDDNVYCRRKGTSDNPFPLMSKQEFQEQYPEQPH